MAGISNSSSGTVTLGENDGILKDTPVITGKTYGIYNADLSGKFYYYDGTIKGKTEAIFGIISGVDTNVNTVITLSNDESYIISNLSESKDIAYVGDDESTTYDTLESAIEACNSDGKITLLKDISIVTGQEKSILENTKINLNLAGKTIRTYVYENAIENNGEFILTDSSEEQSGIIKGYGNKIIHNSVNSTLNIESGTVSLIQPEASIYLTNILNDGTLNINGGIVSTTTPKSYIVNNTGKIEITSGTLQSSGKNGYGIRNLEEGTVKISGGNISTSGTDGRAIYSSSTGKIEILNGEINTTGSNSDGIISDSTGTIEISGGAITSTGVTVNRNKTGGLLISGGTIRSTSNYGISNTGAGTVTISGGEVGSNSNYSINNTSGTITIENGTISGAKGINNSSTLRITKGTISATNGEGINNVGGTATILEGTITSQTASGIVNTATLTLGENDNNTPGVVTPEIIGKIYGVQNNGTFNFYDGILRGEDKALSGSATNTPEYYTVVYLNESETEAILGILANIENTIEINGQFYETIEDAILNIKSSESKTGTIRINNDMILQNSITIPEEINLTLALQGHKILYKENGTAIANNGTLNIIDYEDISESDGEVSIIEAEIGVAIQNNGVLQLGQTDNVNSNSPKIIGTTAILGNEYTVLSGEIVNTDTNVGVQNLKKVNAIKKLYGIDNTSEVIGALLNSIAPKLSKSLSLPNWTKDSVTVTAVSDIMPVLNLYVEEKTKDLSYTVEYYKDGNKVEEDTQTEEKNVKISEADTMEVDKTKINMIDKYLGYKLDETKTGEIPDEVENGAIIKVYYEIDVEQVKNLSYTVEYYKDGEIVEDDTETETKEVQFLEPDTIEVDKVKIDVSGKYLGYRFDRTDPAEIPDTVENGDVIKVYYEKANFNYTIEYYYNNERADILTETQPAKYEDKITEYRDNLKVGYKLDKVEPEELVISAVSENNVMRVYYITDEEQTKELSYTVEYYKYGICIEEDTQVETTTVQVLEPNTLTVDKSKINTTNKYTGHKFDEIATGEIPDVVETRSVIRIYYIKDEEQTKDLSYTVEYYKDGEKAEEDRVITTVQVLDPDTIEVDKTRINTEDKYEGYKFDKTVPEEIPDIVEDGTVLRVYYNKEPELIIKDTKYRVEYYYNGEIDNEKTDIIDAKVGDIITEYEDKSYGNYYLLSEENLPMVLSEDEEKNIIKIYYKKLAPPIREIEYTVLYYKNGILVEEDTQIEKKQTELQVDTILVDKTKINIVDKYEGYVLDEEATGEIPDEVTEDAEIKIYYITPKPENTKIKYTIEYYYNGEKDETKTEKLEASYGELIISYPNKIKEGYKLEKTENLPMVIIEDEEKNVMKVFYVEEQKDEPNKPEEPNDSDGPNNPEEPKDDPEGPKDESKEPETPTEETEEKPKENEENKGSDKPEETKKPETKNTNTNKTNTTTKTTVKVENKIETKPTTTTENKVEKKYTVTKAPKTEDSIIKTIIMLITSSLIAVVATIKKHLEK